ncbi:MAG: ribbon-helix-helix protein, CopG family [Thermosynechococcaceae cyanobacterium]
MSETATITVRLDAQLKQTLEALSKSTQRSKSWLAAEAIAAYVDQEAWQLQQVEEALQQAEQPDAQWVPHEKVSAWLNTWGEEDEVATAPCP